jgi:hypothetical protein
MVEPDEIGTFIDFFENVDDDLLMQMYMYDPKSLYRMCTFLTLDLQMKIENDQRIEKIIS